MSLTRRLLALALLGLVVVVLVTGTTSVPVSLPSFGPSPAASLAVTRADPGVTLVGLGPTTTSPTTSPTTQAGSIRRDGRDRAPRDSTGDGTGGDVTGGATGGAGGVGFSVPSTPGTNLDPTTTDPPTVDDFDHVEVSLDRVNPDGVSWFSDLFTLQNAGETALCVWVSDDVVPNDPFAPDRVRWFAGDQRDAYLDAADDCVVLGPGDSLSVGAVVNAVGVSGGSPGVPATGTQLVVALRVEASPVSTTTGDPT